MPSFSPDGQWIAFWSAPKILKVSLRGGAPVTISEPGTIPYGLAWAPDGRIIFARETPACDACRRPADRRRR